MARFELATSCAQGRRANQTALHPDRSKNHTTPPGECKQSPRRALMLISAREPCTLSRSTAHFPRDFVVAFVIMCA